MRWNDWPILCHYRTVGMAWFRVLGFGLHVRDVRLHRLLFSERNGYIRFLRLGPWVIKALTPNGY